MLFVNSILTLKQKNMRKARLCSRSNKILISDSDSSTQDFTNSVTDSDCKQHHKFSRLHCQAQNFHRFQLRNSYLTIPTSRSTIVSASNNFISEMHLQSTLNVGLRFLTAKITFRNNY